MERRYTYFCILAIILLWSCATKKENGHAHEGESTDSDWEQMDEFHEIMAATFHPYKDSANLEPVKRRATELMTSADHWAASPLPEKVDNDNMKARLRQLKSETETLAETVRSGEDEEIAEQLTHVHDTFHEIHEAWFGAQ